jgi:hypothetical protein
MNKEIVQVCTTSPYKEQKHKRRGQEKEKCRWETGQNEEEGKMVQKEE